MSSLYDELAAKVAAEPSLRKPSVARFDLTLLLFNSREAIRDLWAAADGCAAGSDAPCEGLSEAVEALRPVFGDRDRH